VPIAVQDGHIRHYFETFRRVRGKDRAEVVWLGMLQPTRESPKYQVEIRYKVGSIPRVWVRSPTLKRDPPHQYADKSLCLYTPWEWRWRDSELIAATILPWAATWLYYYELWLDRDEWLGPETPHGDAMKQRTD
jgi:hypothetical protein